MFSAVIGFRTTSINVANGYFSTFNANTEFQTCIPSSDGNSLYLSGIINSTTDPNILWLKVNNINGARISSQKMLGNSNSDTGQIAALDSSENSYVGGRTTVSTGPTVINASISKYSSTGNLVWQKELASPLSVNKQAGYSNVACEAGGGNIYASGTISMNTGSGSDPTGITHITKYNSNGNILYQKRTTFFLVGNTVYDGRINDLTVDSSNNLYISGLVTQSFDGNATYKNSGCIQKRNSSDTVQWDSNFYDSTNTSNVAIIQSVVDTNGNVYACGDVTGSVVGPSILSKVHSNGAISWIKDFANCNITTVSLDNTGNIFAAGRLKTDLSKSWYASIDESTGNISWQNFLQITGSNLLISDINYANSYLYIGGVNQTPNVFNGFSMKVASDGNTTGSFGFVNISTGNVSVSTSSIASGGDNIAFSTTSLTASNGNSSVSSGVASRRIIPF